MLVAHDGVERYRLLSQELEDSITHLGQIVLGVKHQGHLFLLRLHRGNVLEVRIGEQFRSKVVELPLQKLRGVDFQFSQDEVV